MSKIVIHRNIQKQVEAQKSASPKLVIAKPSSAAHIAQGKRVGPGGDEGRYRIDEVIGTGGAGQVCRAYDMLLDMEVAIKFLNPDLIRDENSIAALKAETRICLQLIHKHIIRIFNLEKRGPNFMLIMEYLKGETLFALMSRFPNGIPLDFVSQVVFVATDALAYAHRHGILHRDLTPSNIFITDDGVLKIIDFGIATNVDGQDDDGGFIVGTPEYMSPEQLRGETLDCRTDIFSLGAVVHQMLTGASIYPPGATFDDMADRPHPPITRLSGKLAEVIETATRFSPADRYESISQFGAAFSAAVVS